MYRDSIFVEMWPTELTDDFFEKPEADLTGFSSYK
jgi:hypothetical protein